MAYNDELENSISDSRKQAIASSSEGTKARLKGIGVSPVRDTFPKRNDTEAETIYRGSGNSLIVLGKDRENTEDSGYGGKGYVRTGMIHLVAGHFGANLNLYKEDPKNPQVANPNFSIDSAYIYISQKADIDNYLNLASGSVGNPRKTSAVAIKSDSLRLIGDRGIKLVTRVNSEDSFRNAILQTKGIDLIAGNDDSELQSMIKGENLISSMNKLVDLVRTTVEGIVDIIHYQSEANLATSTHQHITGVPGSPTGILKTDLITSNQKASYVFDNSLNDRFGNIIKDLESFRTQYLDKSGETYVASRFNKTN